MIPDSLAPGIVIPAPNKTSARESGDEATNPVSEVRCVLSILDMELQTIFVCQ